MGDKWNGSIFIWTHEFRTINKKNTDQMNGETELKRDWLMECNKNKGECEVQTKCAFHSVFLFLFLLRSLFRATDLFAFQSMTLNCRVFGLESSIWSNSAFYFLFCERGLSHINARNGLIYFYLNAFHSIVSDDDDIIMGMAVMLLRWSHVSWSL